MSVMKRLLISSKAAFGRPLSREDIYTFCEGLIKRPPIPREWRETFSKTFANIGSILLTVEDYYREELLKPALEKIAAAPTRAMQRETCIREVLTDMHWRTWYVCYNAAKTDVGRAMVDQKLAHIWKDKTPEDRYNFLMHFYMMAVPVQSVLTTVGTTLLGVTKEIETQIELCSEYERGIMMLEVNIMDYACEQQADITHALVGWKDDNLNPITTRMFQFLEATRNKIALGSFDINEFHAATKAFEVEKQQLANRLRSGELF